MIKNETLSFSQWWNYESNGISGMDLGAPSWGVEPIQKKCVLGAHNFYTSQKSVRVACTIFRLLQNKRALVYNI